jgi:multidrug efflux pump subunit AcrA (membrane-fusion protein)
MKKRDYIAIGLLVFGGILFLTSAFLRRPDSDLDILEVVRGPLQVWTAYDGTIQSRTVRGVSSQLGGGATITDLIPEGSHVTKGSNLAKLDATGFERELLRMHRDYALARAEYESLTNARIPLEKREMEIRLLQAKSDLQDAEDSLSDLRELAAEKLIPEHDAIQQDKKNALLRAAVENIEQQLKLTSDFLHPSALDRAKAALESAESEWKIAQRQMEQSVIEAPSDGIVVYQPVAVGSEFRSVRVGDTVYKNQVFITLPDMSNLIVQVDVPEYELTLAQTGRTVVVQPLAYPGMKLSGVVESVGSMAQTRPDRPGRQKFFQVVVRLLESRSELRSGMSARVHILSHDEKDAVKIPRTAVTWENNEPYCQVLKDTQPRRQKLVLGVAGPQEYSVLEGLQAGQRIVVP